MTRNSRCLLRVQCYVENTNSTSPAHLFTFVCVNECVCVGLRVSVYVTLPLTICVLSSLCKTTRGSLESRCGRGEILFQRFEIRFLLQDSDGLDGCLVAALTLRVRTLLNRSLLT